MGPGPVSKSRGRMRKMLNVVGVMAVGLCLAAGAVVSAQEKPVPPPAQGKDKPATADAITGEWEGAVEMPDGAMPFSMKLKLESAKVTGEVGSQQGAAAISEGSYVDGKLTINFTYVDGNAVVMTGGAADGQLTGSLNYGGGQMVANWTAKKKPAK
jgi:hypothetical protein